MAKKATGKKPAAKTRKSGTTGKRSTQRRSNSKANGLVAGLRQRPVLAALALAAFAIVATAALSLIGGRDSLPVAMVEPPPAVESPVPRPGSTPRIPEAKPVEAAPADIKAVDIKPADTSPVVPERNPPPLTDVPPRSSTPVVVPVPPLDRPVVPAPLPLPETPQVAVPPAAPPAVPPPVAAPPPKAAGEGWRKHAVPAPSFQGKPAIAIVIDDMGVDRKRSNGIAALPGPLTLSWLPYARDLKQQASAARARGHELMLHIPMEPTGNADPGPDALKVGLGEAEIQRRARKALASFDGFVGVNNHMGSRFTADRDGMVLVMREFRQRNLLWLDSRTTAKTVGPAVAREMRVPHLGRDIFLDNDATVGAIARQLAQAESVARQRGSAIAIGHPYDATIKALADWLPDARKRGFVIVPVSAMLRTTD